MAARVCSECGLAYPASEAATCPACGSVATTHKSDVDPYDDWEDRVRRRKAGLSVEEERRESWRLNRLRELGYWGETLDELLWRRDIDWHELSDLIAAGCKPSVAARILL